MLDSNEVQTENANMQDSNLQDVGTGENSGGNNPQMLHAPGVDVLDSILSSSSFGEPVVGEWIWTRKSVALPIRSLTNEEFRNINRRNTKRLQIKGTAQVISDLDSEGYNNDIISLCLLQPNLNDPDVRRKVATRAGHSDRNTVSDVISFLFLPGEVTSLAMKIIELSGFNDNEEETVRTLKG